MNSSLGEFEHPGYGRLAIRLEGKGEARKLSMKLNDVERPLEHFHYDTFQVSENPLDPFEKLKVTLPTNSQGDIAELEANLEPSVKEIVFKRVAEKRMFESSFLRQFVGVYDSPGQPMTVALVGEKTLQLVFPGAPPRKLIPRHGTRFDVNEVTGVTLEFKLDAAGQVQEVVVYTPGLFIDGRGAARARRLQTAGEVRPSSRRWLEIPYRFLNSCCHC